MRIGKSNRERTRLQKKLRRIERKYENINPDAILLKRRLEKEAQSVMRKLE